MSRTRLAFTAAAESMTGTPFRLHGRDEHAGLDCVGLVLVALARIGRPIAAPQDYGLRNLDYQRFLPLIELAGFEPAEGPLQAGDLVLAQPGPAQVHLLVACRADRFVHAHAGLGRVVVTPGPLGWPILGCWRLSQD